MKRYGEEFILNQEIMDIIAPYMDDEKREKVHFELAPLQSRGIFKALFGVRPGF